MVHRAAPGFAYAVQAVVGDSLFNLWPFECVRTSQNQRAGRGRRGVVFVRSDTRVHACSNPRVSQPICQFQKVLAPPGHACRGRRRTSQSPFELCCARSTFLRSPTLAATGAMPAAEFIMVHLAASGFAYSARPCWGSDCLSVFHNHRVISVLWGRRSDRFTLIFPHPPAFLSCSTPTELGCLLRSDFSTRYVNPRAIRWP